MITFKTVLHRAFSQPAFLVVVAVMLVSAIALSTATNKLGLVFKKLPVPQPTDHPFKSIPALMGHWLQVSADEKLEPEIQDTLGTDKYIYRDYVRVDDCGSEFIQAVDSVVYLDGMDRIKIDGATTNRVQNAFRSASFDKRVELIQDAMKDKKPGDLKLAMLYVQSHHPNGIINMGLTYYTGLVDTVAHVPDRCYIADGYDTTDLARVHPIWDLGKDRKGKDQSIEVRLMHFEDQTASNRVAKTVAYVFNVDGAYTWDPIEVRRKLQSLTQKYGYYEKTELMQIGADQDDAASKAMTDFLSGAKPEIESCLPDWEKVNNPAK